VAPVIGSRSPEQRWVAPVIAVIGPGHPFGHPDLVGPRSSRSRKRAPLLMFHLLGCGGTSPTSLPEESR